MIRYDAVIPLVEAVKSYKESTDCEIITNGTLFREDEIIRLVSFKLDRVLFSIDGPNPEIHDNLRGVGGSFEKASKNLKSFSEWKKKLKTDKPYLKVNMVLNAKNIGRIAEMVRFLKEADAQELALHPMREYWKSASQTNSLKLDERKADLLKDNIEQARKISKELGIFLNTDMLTVERGGVEEKNKSGSSNELTEKITGLRCFEPFYTILIDPQGNAAPCSPVGRGLPNSNVLRLGLSQIWYENFGETRENILKNVSYDYCRNCGLLDMHEHLRKKMIEFVGKNSRKNS
jgi:MoaA/NifB/PqqE/SkfB family radical SAM enzyme